MISFGIQPLVLSGLLEVGLQLLDLGRILDVHGRGIAVEGLSVVLLQDLGELRILSGGRGSSRADADPLGRLLKRKVPRRSLRGEKKLRVFAELRRYSAAEASLLHCTHLPQGNLLLLQVVAVQVA